MRAYDWSQTPLGAPETWPQSLKSVIQILLSSRFAMWMAWGPDLTFFCNDAYLPTTGLKQDWVLGARSDAVWSEIWPDIGPRISHVLTTSEATWDEALLLYLERNRFSEETYHTFSYSPVADDEGAIAGMLCVVTEVTERIIGERQLALLRDVGARLAGAATRGEAMRALEAALVMEPRDLPFVVAYLRDREPVALRQALHGLGPRSRLAPDSIALAETDAIWPVADVLRSAVAQTAPVPPETAGDLVLSFWQKPPEHARVVPIVDGEGGEPLGVLVAGLNPHRAQDIRYSGFIDLLVGQVAAAVARADAYERERARAEALAELDRAKTAFFSNVSHEFRTPLTLMLNPVEELLASAPDGGPERALLDVAYSNAQRLLKLVNALLDFSRIEAGRYQARYEPVDLAALTAELASAFRSVTEQAGLRLEVIAGQLPQAVFVDRDMWEKVVLNLMSNAFKFTFEGGIGVSVTSAPDGSSAVLTVSDTGTGIPATELPRLFERFHTVAGARGRSMEGSGIGLALVKELVALHGGTIAVDSVPDQGTRFTVTVPFGTAHLPPEQVHDTASPTRLERAGAFISEARRWLKVGEPAMATPDAPPRASEHGGRVLLADDNADMRAYLERLLRDAGFSVHGVGDGRAALEAAQAGSFHMLLSDVMMPELDGFALLAALRADPKTRDLPILLLSARAGEEARVEALRAGANEYLIKPFNARELVASVTGLVRLSQLRQATERRNEGQRRILERIARGAGLDQTLDEIALFIEAEQPGAKVGIVQTNPAGTHLLRSRGPSLPAAYHDALEGLPVAPPFIGICASAIARGEPVSVPDIAADIAHSPQWRDMVLAHRLRAARSTPVLDAAGRAIAALVIYYHEARAPLPPEPTLIDVGTYLASIALESDRIERARAEATARLESLNAELEQRVADALAERKLLADIVEGTDAFVQVVDPDFRWLAINRAAADEFETIFGVRPRVGLSMLDLLADRPEHRASVHAVWSRALAGEEFTEIGTFGDPAGPRRSYEMKYNTLRGEGGRAIGAYQFVYDVTARIENERRLAETQAQLHEMQKMETVGQLTGGIAHDFNNLLTPIYSTLELLLRRAPHDERAARLINGALQAAERARILVGRLLTFARRQALETRPVEIPTLVQGMLELVDRSLGPMIEVQVNMASELPLALVDPNQLELALLNLCVNARDAMPSGGKLGIETASALLAAGQVANLGAGAYVRLRVTDTGVGMDADTLRRAIDPFFTTKGIGRGTGLGLSMVHGLAAQSGGALLLDSAPGRGTTATLYLPIASQDAVPSPDRSPIAAMPTRPLHVLLVDDEDLVRAGLRNMLEDLGHHVTEAASGRIALDQLQRDPGFELLVTDHLMPGMAGTVLIHEARSIRADLPVLVITGYGGLPSDSAPGVPRVGKPLRADELSNAIASALSPTPVVSLASHRISKTQQ